MLRAFSDEFSCNFYAHTVASSCPAGNADGLRLIDDVRRLLAATHNTAAGEDVIPGKVLKFLCCELAEPPNIIFQWSIAESNFPAAWKNAIVQPILKGRGNQHQHLITKLVFVQLLEKRWRGLLKNNY